jgi:hypothetical protein
MCPSVKCSLLLFCNISFNYLPVFLPVHPLSSCHATHPWIITPGTYSTCAFKLSVWHKGACLCPACLRAMAHFPHVQRIILLCWSILVRLVECILGCGNPVSYAPPGGSILVKLLGG